MLVLRVFKVNANRKKHRVIKFSLSLLPSAPMRLSNLRHSHIFLRTWLLPHLLLFDGWILTRAGGQIPHGGQILPRVVNYLPTVLKAGNKQKAVKRENKIFLAHCRILSDVISQRFQEPLSMPSGFFVVCDN